MKQPFHLRSIGARHDFWLLAVFFGATRMLFSQGNIVPTTAPNVPIMKTLQQVEPRIPLETVGGDLNTYHHIISTPGSYYLTANLNVIKTHGIHVTAPGVTIDLNGFEIRRTALTGGFGIEIDSTAERCTVKNGSVRGLATGIGGIGASCTLRDLRVSSCTAAGIKLAPVPPSAVPYSGFYTVIDRCQVSMNGVGIWAGPYSRISECIASDGTDAGIIADVSSSITNCTSSYNQGTGIKVSLYSKVSDCLSQLNRSGEAGIRAGERCSVIHCSSIENSSSDAVSAGIMADKYCTIIACISSKSKNSITGNELPTSGAGIIAGIGSLVKDCIVVENKQAGILVGDGSTLISCTARSHGSATSSAGVGFGIGSGSTIKDCTATDCASGIFADQGSTIEGNTCRANRAAGIACGAKNRIVQNNSTENGFVGISAGGAGNLIDGNHVRDNAGKGIEVTMTNGKNVIIRNEAGNNAGGSYASIAPGNQMAPTGDPTTSVNPFLNIIN